MAIQTFQLSASRYLTTAVSVQWTYDAARSSRPSINADLRSGSFSKYFDSVQFYDLGVDAGRVVFTITNTNTVFEAGGGAGDDLSTAFENNGSIQIVAGGQSLIVAIGGVDSAEPYVWTPANSDEVIAFADALRAAGASSASVTIRDFTPTVDHAVDAGGVTFAFDLPEPTVTHTPAPTSTLATSDWDGTGYQAPIVLALLPATISGSADITADPVTAIDGDLVVAADLTIDGVERIGIGIRLRRTGSARLDFYFDDSGSPLYPDAKAFIVIDDTARTQIPFSIAATAGGFNNWAIDSSAQQALITAIATGDRFVLAIAEPAAGTTDHAVDAGAVSWAFALPQPTVTHTPAGAAATRLFIADSSGDELWEIDPDGADSQGTSRTLPANLTSPDGMAVFNGRLLVVDNTGDELWELDPDGADLQGLMLRILPANLGSPHGMTVFNGRLLIVDNDGDELWEVDPDGADSQGDNLRDLPSGLGTPRGMTAFNGRLFLIDSGVDELWEVDPDGADTEGEKIRDLPSGLTSGQGMTVFDDRLFVSDLSGDELWELDPDGADSQGIELRILPVTLTFPVSMAALGLALGPTDHAVNAGAVSWAFALPEPTVTHTPAAATTDHAVDAGGVSWAFNLPQPTVTHVSLVPVDHAVNAGAVSWAFALPEPTVTHTPAAATTDHAVDAGGVSWAFNLPQPTVTHVSLVPVDHAVNAGAVAWAFDLPEPSVTHTPAGPMDHAVDAGSVAFAFDLPQPTVTHTSAQPPIDIDGAIELPAEWVEGGGAAWLRRLVIEVDGRLTLELATTATGSGGGAGPDLTADVIERLQIGIGSSLTVVGIGDDTEPYSWIPDNAAEVQAFYDAHAGGPVALTLTLGATYQPGSYDFVTPQNAALIPNFRDTADEDGSMAGIGVMGSETLPCLVSQVRAFNDLSAQLLLVPLGNEIHDAETGPIPPYDPKITIPSVSSEFSERLLAAALEEARGRDGADGAGFEVVFRRTSTDVAPAVPITSADQRAMDDFVPFGWTDDPLGPTNFSPYEWVTIRTGSTQAWGPFTTVSLWARFGADGAGVEWIFRLAADATAPATPVTTFTQRATDDFVPNDWHDDAQQLTDAMPYQWFSIRRGTTGAWNEFATPKLLARPGSRVHNIGSDTQPAATLGNVGDTAINDAGLFWLKTGSGWQFRGDLTPSGGEIHFLDTLPPANSFGANGDIAIGPDGRIMEKASGTWSDITLDIPAIADLTATITALYLGRLESGGFHSWDLAAQWTAAGVRYLVEIDVGSAPTSLTGADSTWNDFSGTASGPTQYDFGRLSATLSPTTAIRARRIGAFGQRGPWAYAYISFTGEPLISVTSEHLEVGEGEGVNVFCWVANATSATLSEVEGSFSQAIVLDAAGNFFDPITVTPSGSGSTYRLSATNADGTPAKDISIGVFMRPATTSPDVSIDEFVVTLDPITPDQTTTLTWRTTNATGVTLGIVGETPSAVTEDGSMLVGPDVTTTYRLTAQGPGGPLTEDVTVTVTGALAQPRIVTFAPDDSTLDTTESTTIRWTLQNVISGTITGPGLNRSLTSSELVSGSISVGPFSTGNKNYSLTVQGETGTTDDTESFTIVVSSTPPPPDEVTIDSFTALPSTVDSGDTVTVTWATSNATSVTLNGVAVSNDGSDTFNPTADTDYVLRASGPGGPVTQTRSVTVTEPPVMPDPTATITANDQIINEGDSVTITWSSTNANQALLRVRLVGETSFTSMNVGTSGMLAFTPSASTVYRIIVWHSDAVLNTAEDQLTVTVGAARPIIDSFSISPSTIDSGDDVTFAWTTTNAVRIRVRVFTVTIFNSSSADGSMTQAVGSPSGIYEITLTAYNADDDEVSTMRTLTIN